MAIFDPKPPTKNDLRIFGMVLALLFGVIGAIVLWRAESLNAAYVIWTIGALVTIVYYVIPKVRLLMYYGLMTLTRPIGWVVSHLLLAITYYLVITPLGWLVRPFVGDLMRRRIDPQSHTNWTKRKATDDPSRYFSQS